MELARLEGRPLDSSFVVRIEGEIDASNAADVTDQITEMVETEASGLIVDLSGTEYLDSAGIRMLFTVQGRLDSHGQGMAIAIPEDSPTRQVLVIAEVPQIIPVAESADDALRLVHPRAPNRSP